MITVLVLAAVTAVLAAGFMSRSAQEARLAGRSLLQSAALNLAEAGVEEGLFAANTSGFTSGNGWELATGSTTDYVKTMTGFDLGQATGTVYIRVDNGTSLTPVVFAAARITIPNQPTLLKQLRVTGTKRRLWANGMVSKGTITFSGNTVIDSYDSTDGVYNEATNRSDEVTVACASTALDPIVVGSNASIYGFVATAGGDPEVGTGGRIYGATTPVGTNVDPSRIRRDFSANISDVTAPTTTVISLPSTATDSTLTLPRVGDTAGANGRYLYSIADLHIAGNIALKVMGPVDLIVTGSISMTGNSYLQVGGTGASSPSLNLYCPGSVAIGGNGMINNTSDPSKSTLWGTAASPASQAITVTGNGAFIGAIYAPNGDVTMAGNGDTSGAVLAKTVTVSGNGKFHYDTALWGVPMDATYRVNSWCELTTPPNSGQAFARDNRQPFNVLF